jgi:hypothetical protein
MSTEGKDSVNGLLANLAVTVKFSEPWELGNVLGWQSREATIVDVTQRVNQYYGNREELALLKLKSAFEFRNTTCEYFVASPRYANESLSSLVSGQSVQCGMTLITAEQATSIDPFDLTKWRGGIAATASLQQAVG